MRRAKAAGSAGMSPSWTRARSSKRVGGVATGRRRRRRGRRACGSASWRGLSSKRGRQVHAVRPWRRSRRCICRSGPKPAAARTTALSTRRSVARTSATASPSAAFSAGISFSTSAVSPSGAAVGLQLGEVGGALRDAADRLAFPIVRAVRARTRRSGRSAAAPRARGRGSPRAAASGRGRRRRRRRGSRSPPARPSSGRDSRPGVVQPSWLELRKRISAASSLRCSLSSQTPSFSSGPKAVQNFS